MPIRRYAVKIGKSACALTVFHCGVAFHKTLTGFQCKIKINLIIKVIRINYCICFFGIDHSYQREIAGF